LVLAESGWQIKLKFGECNSDSGHYMSKTPTGNELIKRLIKDYNCCVVRRAKGSHCTIMLIEKNGTKLATTIQATNKELKIGVINAISRKIKIPKDELLRN